jgi:outer membrane protein assembly factor BamB
MRRAAGLILLLAAVRMAAAEPLLKVRPLPDTIPLVAGGVAVADIVSGEATRLEALALQAAVKLRTGVELPILADQSVDLGSGRNLVLLGNLTNNQAIRDLYLQSYTFEDLAYPGGEAFVIRPLVDPLGNGHHIIVAGASTDAGLQKAVAYLASLLPERGGPGRLTLPVTLHIEGLSPTYQASRNFAEVGPASAYVKTGDRKYAEAYRQYVLKEWMIPDEALVKDAHLLYWKKALSWELMEASGVFSDQERLTLTNQVLKIVRSPDGCQYVRDMASGPGIRGNHVTRAGMGFFYATRYFGKYYRDQIPATELETWRRTLSDYWSLQLRAYRSLDEAYSQHAFGGSLDNMINLALAIPELGGSFLTGPNARKMADYLLTLCDNLGWCPVSGDSSFSDYPVTVLQKLAYACQDGRYLYPVSKFWARGTSSDECLRDFAAGLRPELPADHVGIHVVAPVEPLFYVWPQQLEPQHVPVAQTFDKLTFRSGWDPQDQYLLLDGVGYWSHAYADMNTVQEFTAQGRVWLCEPDAFRGPTMKYHNGLTYVRDGLGPAAPQGFAELQATAEGKSFGYVRSALPSYGEADWVRHILWNKGQSFFVLDQLVAKTPGHYSATVRWRGLGEATMQPGRYEALQDEHEPGEMGPEELLKAVVAPGLQCKHAYYTCEFLLVPSSKIGDAVEFPLKPEKTGDYVLKLRMLCTRNYGTVQAKLDGQPLGRALDTCDPDGVSLSDLDLGPVACQAGQTRTLRVEVVGSNAISPGCGMSIAKLIFRPVGATPDTPHTGFSLCFDPGTSASMEHDADLGRLVVPLACRRSVLNVLALPRSRQLQAGESLGVAGMFGAWQGTAVPKWELRQVDERTAVVKTGPDLTLYAAGDARQGISVGPLKAEAEFLRLDSTQIVTVRGRRASLSGRELLTSGEAESPVADAKAVGSFLTDLWQRTRPTLSGQVVPAWAGQPRLTLVKQQSLPAATTALAPFAGGVVVGTEAGQVLRFGPTGEPLGNFSAQGAVRALATADLEADGLLSLLVGTETERLYALGPDLQPQWERKIEYHVKPWLWYTLQGAKVRAIAAGDLTGEGRPQVILGLGDAGVQGLDNQGQPRWYRETQYGVPQCLVLADVLGRGKPQVVAGIGGVSGMAQGFVFAADGAPAGDFRVEGSGAGINALVVADLTGKGKPSVCCGTNSGKVGCYELNEQQVWQERWTASVGDAVRRLVVLDDKLVVASDTGYLVALDGAGRLVWSVDMGAAVATETTVKLASGQLAVAAASEDGHIVVVDGAGNVLAWARVEDTPAAATSAANGQIAVAGRKSLWMLAMPQ